MEKIAARSRGEDVSYLASEEKREFLSRLLARMAHEIRNPLSSLDIHFQLLEEDVAKLAPQIQSRTAGRFDVVRGELRRLNNIVEQFLRLANPSGLKIETINLRRIIAHVSDLLRPEAKSRGISIEVSASGGLPDVRADWAQLTQALLNVLINALQAIDRDGQIEIRVKRTKRIWVAIEIQDSGPGVPVEKKGAIFEPYFSTKREGSGIGLWIAQQIVLAHGGDIHVSDGPSGGAKFTLSLPIQGKDEDHG